MATPRSFHLVQTNGTPASTSKTRCSNHNDPVGQICGPDELKEISNV